MGADAVVARFEISSTRYVGPDGVPAAALPEWADRQALVELYAGMVRTRAFDARAVALQRGGQLGTFASSLGQEAVSIGMGAAMEPADVLLPSFREQGAMFWRGVRMSEVLGYWGGDERGMDFAGPREDFPISVPVGTHASHAAGVAMAFRLRGEPRAAVCALGDGATSKGDFYEALNFAGVRRLPLVMVVNNNQWAISVPRAEQTAAQTLAQKAVAAGIAGEQVDGNDVIAVRERVTAALTRARAGDGPTLIEAVTYRLTDHTTADDAGRYRAEEQVSAAWKAEPVARLRALLVARQWWTRQDEEALLTRSRGEVEDAVDEYLATHPQPATAMFDYLYATLPASLAAQRAEVAARYGDG